MDDCAGKHERNENESMLKRQNPDLRSSSSFKREDYKRQKNETFEQNEGPSKTTKKAMTSKATSKVGEKHQRLLHEITEENEAPSSKTMYDLPLEMMNIILQKSYLHWIVNLSTKQKDEEVIRSLISVDVCFYERMTRQRFKRTIWRYLKNFYGKIKKRSAIIRNNRNYLLENIQPNDELIASLLSLCITEEQSHFIQRQRSSRGKNDKLLYFIRSFGETNFSNFVKCLRQTNQKTVARILENGGALIKIEVQTRGAKCTTSIETQLLHQKLEDIRSRSKPLSHQTDKLISQLREEGIEIINSHLIRQTVVVCIWCYSQAALEYIQRLYESNQLRDVLLENIHPSISKVINIDRNQFKKTIVVCPLSINFTQRIEIGGGNKEVRGVNKRAVTKLRNEIYVLCRSYPNEIRVFEDRIPFRHLKTIEVKEIKTPWDIGSSDKENCLYVSDDIEKCVWKITRETDDEHKIINWLTTDYMPRTLSESNDGQLLVVNDSSSILMIYGSDAELIRSIQLPRNIKDPLHAVETSFGNFIILHSWLEEEKGESGSSGRERVGKWVVSELTRDGQTVVRRFTPSNETQELNEPQYLSLDSDDQVFVADTEDGRVILLDCDLKWNRILCPIKEEKKLRFQLVRHPKILCYDEEKKQLIVGRLSGYLGEVNVYTLSRN